MDPNKALAELRAAAHELGKAVGISDTDPLDILGHQVVEHFHALDEWLSKGGFLPDRWREPNGPVTCAACGNRTHTIKRLARDDDYTPAAMDATDPLGPPNPAGVELPS